eukprot:172495-Ditylum_brightwellii.AAC.1
MPINPVTESNGVGHVSLNKKVVTRVNYMFSVEHDSNTIPLSDLLGDLNINLFKAIELLLSSDKPLQFYATNKSLDIVNVNSSENDDSDLF